MSQSLKVGFCVYCGAQDGLTREHVLPYGLGGDQVLGDASCGDCAEITSRLERRLLRGHWWPYRQFLGLPSRRSGEVIPDLPVTVNRADGTTQAALLPMGKQSLAMVFDFDPPSVLSGIVRADVPFAPRAGMKLLAESPNTYVADGREYRLLPGEQLTVPVNFDATDLARFLAKVAHCYAVLECGTDACVEYYLPRLVLGDGLGALTYVGGCSEAFAGRALPGDGLHAMQVRETGQFLSVCIQLFRDGGDPPPIYEVVVGSRFRDTQQGHAAGRPQAAGA